MGDTDFNLLSLSSNVDTFVLSLLQEQDFQKIAEKLSAILNKAIMIEDTFFRVLGKSPKDNIKQIVTKPQLDDPVIQNYVHRAHIQKLPTIMPPLPQYGVRQSRIIFPIITGDIIQGTMHIFFKEDKPVFTDIEKRYINKALTALSFMVLLEEKETKTKETFLNNLYNRLISGQHFDIKALQDTTAIFDLDLSIPTWLLLVQIKGDSSFYYLKALKSFFQEKEPEAKVFFLRSGIYLIIISENRQTYKKAEIIHIARQLLEVFLKYYSKSVIYITLGRKCLIPEDYAKSYHEALKSLDFLKECESESQVLSFNSLDKIGLLTLSEDVGRLIAFANQLLKPLIEYDFQNPTINLIETLESFLKNNNQAKQTSQDLFIHINTLRYRLDKIRELGKYNLDDAETKFQLYFALKIFNLKKTLTHCHDKKASTSNK